MLNRKDVIFVAVHKGKCIDNVINIAKTIYPEVKINNLADKKNVLLFLNTEWNDSFIDFEPLIQELDSSSVIWGAFSCTEKKSLKSIGNLEAAGISLNTTENARFIADIK